MRLPMSSLFFLLFILSDKSDNNDNCYDSYDDKKCSTKATLLFSHAVLKLVLFKLDACICFVHGWAKKVDPMFGELCPCCLPALLCSLNIVAYTEGVFKCKVHLESLCLAELFSALCDLNRRALYVEFDWSDHVTLVLHNIRHALVYLIYRYNIILKVGASITFWPWMSSMV